MFCQNCGKENSNESKFCIACGFKLQSEMVSQNNPDSDSNTVVNTNTTNELVECSSVITKTDAPAEPVNYFGESEQKKQKRDFKKLLRFVKPILALIIVGLVIFTGISVKDKFFSKNDPTKSPILYVKDGDLNVRSYGKSKSYDVSDVIDEDHYFNIIQLTNDSKTMFFITNDSKLYYRKVDQEKPKGKDADDTGIKIASDVKSFNIQKDGKFVLYLKNDKLYYSNLKEEKTVSSDVSSYYLDKDQKKVLFYKNKKDLYVYEIGKAEPEKIDSDITSIVSSVFDCSKIYYLKDNSLYLKENGKDKSKLASDVENAFIIGKQVYVSKKDEATLSFNDLFNDDVASSDKNIKLPQYSDFKKVQSFYFGGTYTTTDYEAYNKAYSKYQEKNERDRIRTYYNNNPQKITTYTIYILKDGLLSKVTDGASTIRDSIGTNAVTFSKKVMNNSNKILMSSVKNYTDATNKVKTNLTSGSTEIYVLRESNEPFKAFDSNKGMISIRFSSDGKYLYAIEEMNNNSGVLNRYDISANSLNSKTKITDSVTDYMTIKDDIIVYSGEQNKPKVGLFTNDKYTEISDNSKFSTIKDGAIFYLEDYNSTKKVGTLYKYQNGKKEKVEDDVYVVDARSDNFIVYIKDYSNNKGDLYYKKGTSKPVKVDSDVSSIIYAQGGF